MKTKIGLTAFSFACAISAAETTTAGSLSDPIVAAPVSIIEQDDWQGLRLGLTFNTEIASNTYATSEGFPFINASNVGSDDLGGFLGFDIQSGNFVFGAELQTLPWQNAVQGFANRIHQDLNSARARIGYAQGKSLFYGSFGLANSKVDDAGNLIDMKGYVAGLGFERKIGKRAFVGFAVDHYVLEGERLANAYEAEHTVAQIRIGFKF